MATIKDGKDRMPRKHMYRIDVTIDGVRQVLIRYARSRFDARQAVLWEGRQQVHVHSITLVEQEG